MSLPAYKTLTSLKKFKEVFHNLFDEVIVLDTEFNAGIGDLPAANFQLNAKGDVVNTGNRPNPVAIVAREVFSGREYRMFQGEFPEKPPYDTGPRTLFLTFVASAEYGTHIALGWPLMEGTSVPSGDRSATASLRRGRVMICLASRRLVGSQRSPRATRRICATASFAADHGFQVSARPS
jgi:hypothetical protein